MAIEYAERIRRIPVYPVASGYDLGADVAMLASNESQFPPVGEVVEAATAVLLEPGAEVVYAWPSFSVYPHLAAASGALRIQVPLDAQDRHDLDAMAREVNAATRLVLVCNPNNPTSTSHPLNEIEVFLDRIPPHVCVILDEAYCEYSLALGDPHASLELLGRHPNLVLLRTFSKVYGLAGLRVGYALCGTDTFRIAVDQVRQPFYLSAVAQAAAVEALRHQDEVERRVVSTVAARATLRFEAERLGLRVADSDANFVWIRLVEPLQEGAAEHEAAVVAGLRDRRVLVRAGTSLGRVGCLRVTVGTEAENERFLAGLAELVQG